MIFFDSKLNDELRQRGYVVLPFFDADELEQVRHLHTKHKSHSPYFHSTTFEKDVEQKKTLNKDGIGVFSEKIQQLLVPHKNLGVSFLTKPVGEKGHMPIHQDWTIVDEERFGSYTIWVPLQDVNEDNGAITVLDGSHKLHKTLRAPSLPVVISEIEDDIRPRMRTLRMKAGEAFIFNHAVIHASHLNSSGTDRIAITYGLIPNEARLYFYHLNADGSTDQYEVPDDFFLYYDNHGERPAFLKPSRTLVADYAPLSKQYFFDFMQDYNLKTMKPIFKDALLQKQFDEQGYALVDMLTTKEVEDLKGFYQTLNNDHIPEFGFHVSLDNASGEFVAGVMSKIKSVVGRAADNVFSNYKIFTSSFVVKEQNPISIVPPHQDWSFTDEDQGYVSATVWTALVDTDMNNGAMGVILGSHKFFDHHRASPAPEFKAPFDSYMFSVFPYIKLIPMKAGQALVFNNKTLHASPPNISNEVRLAVGFGVTQADAPMRHYYLKPGTDGKTLLEYEIDDYFFTHYNNGKLLNLYREGKTPDDLKLIGEVNSRVPEVAAEDLIERIKAHSNTFNTELCEHLAKLFNYSMDGTPKEELQIEINQQLESTAEVAIETSSHEEPEPVIPTFINEENKEAIVVNSIDNRSFFQKYTPLNIYRELRERVLS